MVWIIEWFAKEREPVPQELIELGDIKQIFKEMWSKYLRRYYDWSVDLMVGLKLKEVRDAIFRQGYYANEYTQRFGGEMNDYCTAKYDSFRVSAVLEDGSTIDNDMVKGFGNEAVETELEEAREWFKDRDIERYMVSYYKDGGCIESEYR